MLPGAHRVAFQRAGKWRIFWYADRTRGTPVLWKGAAATRAEAEALERAEAPLIAERYSAAAHPRPAHGFVSRLIGDYRDSDAFRSNAESTKKLWGSHLDAIDDVFGSTSLAGIQQKGVRKLIKAWHAKMEDNPRKANTALTVLVRLFEYGVDVEDLQRNPAAGLARLDEGEGRAGVVWTEAEFAKLLDARQRPRTNGRPLPTDGQPLLGPARQNALRLAYLTGLRREDLIRLRWDEVDFEAAMIRRTTLKSRKKKRVARINIGPELRALLLAMKPAEDAPVKAVMVVTNELGRPYKSPGAFSSGLLNAFESADIRAPIRLGDDGKPIEEEGRRKHFHDLRGTRATLRFAEGCTDAEAEIWFGWAPGSGGKMRGIYGDPESIALAAGRRLGTGGQRAL
jgi:integrase